jgi:hypothetical protein
VDDHLLELVFGHAVVLGSAQVSTKLLGAAVGDQTAQVRQKATVRAPPWVVRPDNGALDPPGGGSTAFAVGDPLLALVRANDCDSGRIDADILLVAPSETDKGSRRTSARYAATVCGPDRWAGPSPSELGSDLTARPA